MQPRFGSILSALVLVSCVASGASAKHKSNTGTEADLEKAVTESPSAPGPWLELARFHDAHDRHVPAILAYTRYLTLNQDPEGAKQAASRVWALVVPEGARTSSTASMRPPQSNDDPWWEADLLLVTFQSARHSGKAASMSDAQFFATMLEGVTLYVQGLGEDKRLSPLWRQVGFPYFVEAQESKYLESLAYDVTAPVSESSAQWVEANREAVARYRAWTQKWKPGS